SVVEHRTQLDRMAHGQAVQTVMPARIRRDSYRPVRPPSDELIGILECTVVDHLGADDHARNRLARGRIDFDDPTRVITCTTRVWILAPWMRSETIRSRPTPRSRNRPSGPVLAGG